MLLSNWTKCVTRDTPAFMAPEIKIDGLTVKSVCINQLKAIGN